MVGSHGLVGTAHMPAGTIQGFNGKQPSAKMAAQPKIQIKLNKEGKEGVSRFCRKGKESILHMSKKDRIGLHGCTALQGQKQKGAG
eukprot:1160757-Pelagomonas_calceolata.AAC.6